jgi:hypothetical protein
MSYPDEGVVTQALNRISAQATRNDSNDVERQRLNNRKSIEELSLPG